MVLACVTALFGVGTASAADICVGGLAAPCGSNQASIQAAVDASASGDTIHINPGSYDDRVTVGNKDLTFTKLAGSVGDVVIESGNDFYIESNGVDSDITIQGIIIDANFYTESLADGSLYLSIDDSEINGEFNTGTIGAVSSTYLTLDGVNIGSNAVDLSLGAFGYFVMQNASSVTSNTNINVRYGTGVDISNSSIYGSFWFENPDLTVSFENNNFYGSPAIAGSAIVSISSPSFIADFTFNNNIFESNYDAGNAEAILDLNDNLNIVEISGNQFATSDSTPVPILASKIDGDVIFSDNQVLEGSYFDNIFDLGGDANYYLNNNILLNDNPSQGDNTLYHDATGEFVVFQNQFLDSTSIDALDFFMNGTGFNQLVNNNMPKVHVEANNVVELEGNTLASFRSNTSDAVVSNVVGNTFTSFATSGPLVELSNSGEGTNVKNNILLQDNDLSWPLVMSEQQGNDNYYINNTFISNGEYSDALYVYDEVVDGTNFVNNLFINNGGLIEEGGFPKSIYCESGYAGFVMYAYNINHGGRAPDETDCNPTVSYGTPLNSDHINYFTDINRTVNRDDYFEIVDTREVAAINANDVEDVDADMVVDEFAGKLLKLYGDSEAMEFYFYILSNDEDQIFLLDPNIDLTTIEAEYGFLDEYKIIDPEILGDNSLALNSGLDNADYSQVPLLDKFENPRVETTDKGATENQDADANTEPVLSNLSYDDFTNTLSWNFTDVDGDTQLSHAMVAEYDGTNYYVTPFGLAEFGLADEDALELYSDQQEFRFTTIYEENIFVPGEEYILSMTVADSHGLMSDLEQITFEAGGTIAMPDPNYQFKDISTLEIEIETPDGFDETAELAIVINQDSDIDYPNDPSFDYCVHPTNLTLVACDFDDFSSIPRQTITDWGNALQITSNFDLESDYELLIIGFVNGTDTLRYAMHDELNELDFRIARFTNSNYDLATTYRGARNLTTTAQNIYFECRHDYYANTVLGDTLAVILSSGSGDSEELELTDDEIDGVFRGLIPAKIGAATLGNNQLEAANGGTISVECNVDIRTEIGVVEDFESYADTAEAEAGGWFLAGNLDAGGEFSSPGISLVNAADSYMRLSYLMPNGDTDITGIGLMGGGEIDMCQLDPKISIRFNNTALISDEPVSLPGIIDLTGVTFAMLDAQFDAVVQSVDSSNFLDGEFVDVIFDDVSTFIQGAGVGFDCDAVVRMDVMVAYNNDSGSEQLLTMDIDDFILTSGIFSELQNSFSALDATPPPPPPNDGGSTGSVSKSTTDPETDEEEQTEDEDNDDEEEESDEQDDSENDSNSEGDTSSDDESSDQDDSQSSSSSGDDENTESEEESNEVELEEELVEEETIQEPISDYEYSQPNTTEVAGLKIARTDRNTDNDKDGCANSIETAYGSDPNNANSLISDVADCDAIYLYNGQTDLSRDFITVNAGSFPSYEFTITGAVNFAEEVPVGAMVNLSLIDGDNFIIDLGSTVVQENNLFIKVNDVQLKDGTYILLASTTDSNGNKINASDTLEISQKIKSEVNLLNFSGIEFANNKPVKNRDNVLKISDKAFAYGRAPLNSTVKAYWNSVLLTSVALADSSEGTFYVEPRDNLAPDEIHTLVLVAESEADATIKSQPLIIKFRVKEKVDLTLILALSLIMLSLLIAMKIVTKKRQLVTSAPNVGAEPVRVDPLNLDQFIN